MCNKKLLSEKEVNDILGPYKLAIEKCIDLFPRKRGISITNHIYIVSAGNNVYNELVKVNARGKCKKGNGYIYFRDDIEITDHLLVHEIIHRLSRNLKIVRKCPPLQWVEGVDFSPKSHHMNEVITEYITSLITGKNEENNPYTIGLEYIQHFGDKVGVHNMIQAYFRGNVRFFKRELGRDYKIFSETFATLIVCYTQCCSTNFHESDKRNFTSAKIVLQSILDIL